jgi:hypothetical protein
MFLVYYTKSKERLAMTKVNEYVDYVNSIQNPNPYPRGGSVGMYIGDIMIKSKKISPTALKLFFVLTTDTNNYGQTNRTRRDIAKALGIKYDPSRISRLFKELEEEEFICLFGDYITINPFLSLARAPSPKIKAALQDAWVDMVELR